MRIHAFAVPSIGIRIVTVSLNLLAAFRNRRPLPPGEQPREGVDRSNREPRGLLGFVAVGHAENNGANVAVSIPPS